MVYCKYATQGRLTLALITWFLVDGISQFFFVQRRMDRFRQRRLDCVVIFIGSRDICV